MSVHIPYNQTPRPYHLVVAGLVGKHAVREGTVLDIGCGVGHCMAAVRAARPDLRLFAADIDTECLRITHERARLDGQIVVGDVADLFGRTESYDVIVMSHSLEHMFSPVYTVREVLRMLKPSGVLVLAVPNPVRPSVILSNLRRKKAVNLGHVVAWDRSHWMNFIEVILGLRALEYAEDYFQIPFNLGDRWRWVRWIEFRLVRLLPWFSMSNIVVVQDAARRETHAVSTA